LLLSVICRLKDEKIPIDYRRKVVSFLKHAISNDDSAFYDELYENNVNKEFTFSVYFYPDTIIRQDYISVVSKKLAINFSTPDPYICIKIYNALSKQRLTWFNISDDNAIHIVEIHNPKEKVITENRAIFKTLSPIVIRDHDPLTKKDWFYTFEDNESIDILRRNLKHELKDKFPRDISKDIDDLKISFFDMKKTVVKSYEFLIPCSLGCVSLEGQQYLIQYIYQRGLGSKRSLGFGMLKLI